MQSGFNVVSQCCFTILLQPHESSEPHIVLLSSMTNAEPGHLNQVQTEQFFSCSNSFQEAHKAYLQPISSQSLLRIRQDTFKAADRKPTPTSTPATRKGKRNRSAVAPKRTSSRKKPFKNYAAVGSDKDDDFSADLACDTWDEEGGGVNHNGADDADDEEDDHEAGDRRQQEKANEVKLTTKMHDEERKQQENAKKVKLISEELAEEMKALREEFETERAKTEEGKELLEKENRMLQEALKESAGGKSPRTDGGGTTRNRAQAGIDDGTGTRGGYRSTGRKKSGRPRSDQAWRKHDGTEWNPGTDGSGATHTRLVRYGLEQALALKDQMHENQLLRVANNNATNKSIVQTLLPF